MSKPKVGDKAPDFLTTDQDGKTVQLKDFLGKKVILFFYPKDNTPGCTKEACSLRDNYKEITDHGMVVLGVSADTERKHQNFISKYELPFPLLADVDKKMIKDYGVWGPKKFMGREFLGILRTTFIIDEEGAVAHVIDKVKTGKHAEQIMEVMGLSAN